MSRSRRSVPGRKKSFAKGISDDSDEDFVVEEEEEEDDDEGEEEEVNFDDEVDEEECRLSDSNDSFVEDEDNVDFEYSNGRRKIVKRRTRSRRMVSSDEDQDKEFVPGAESSTEEEEVEEEEGEDREGWITVKKKTKGVKRKKSSRRGSAKRRKTAKKTKKVLNKRRRRRQVDDSEDEDFVLDDEEEVEKKESKKLNSGNGRTNARKLRLSADSDSDFIVSEKDVEVFKGVSSRGVVPPTRSSKSKRCLIAGNSISPPPRLQNNRKSSSTANGEFKCELKLKVVNSGRQVCGICLSEERKEMVRGRLNSCDHYFCFPCIMEWSRVESRCPMCKQRFSQIHKSNISGIRLRREVIKVPQRDQVYQPSEEELRGYLDPYANIMCIVCQQGGDDNLMLLCDICDSSAHTYCVGLGREVPEGNWYCEGCRVPNPASRATPHLDLNLPASDDYFCPEDFAAGNNLDVHDANSMPYGDPRNSQVQGNDLPAVDLQEGSTPTSASTVSGRRRQRRHIHIRLRQLMDQNDGLPNGNPESDSVKSEVEQNGVIENFGSVATDVYQNGRYDQNSTLGSCGETSSRSLVNKDSSMVCSLRMHSSQAHTNTTCVVPDNRHLVDQSSEENVNNTTSEPDDHCMNTFKVDKRSSIEVYDAKERVRAMVKSHLKPLCRGTVIGKSQYKALTRESTQAILASCGLEHSSNAVASAQVPVCQHAGAGTKSDLLRQCCTFCFNAFVNDVVRMSIDRELQG